MKNQLQLVTMVILTLDRDHYLVPGLPEQMTAEQQVVGYSGCIIAL